MKIPSVDQIKAWDIATLGKENISGWELMERAATCLFEAIERKFPQKNHTFHVFCGAGNNGGDGLALARKLFEAGYRVLIYLSELPEKYTEATLQNFFRIPDELHPIFLTEKSTFYAHDHDIFIDAFFGSGLNRALSGHYIQFITALNKFENYKISIDMPSGMFADRENSSTDVIFKTDLVLSLEVPKLSFFFVSNACHFQTFEVIPISLSTDFGDNLPVSTFLIDEKLVKSIYKHRFRAGHKGTYGHVVLVGGSKGKVGAITLSTKAALKTGAGLVTSHVPGCALAILQIAIPEAMCNCDKNDEYITVIWLPSKANAIGIGPGMGINPETELNLIQFLDKNTIPCVLDADSLNIIAKKPEYIQKIKPNTILTPHLGEFTRLFGEFETELDRFNFMKSFSAKNKIIICLKGQHTAISTPEGELYFNSTGNAGMATGGSGDTLTGIIASLLAQQYSAKEAAILGVYLHGLAGDLALENESVESLAASDIINHIGKAFKKIN